MDRDEFYTLLAGRDEAALKKTLWTLYWKGARPVRERIEALLGVVPPEAASVDPQFALRDVKHFAALARSGAYLGRDRRVSPKDRTSWRFTFRDLVKEARVALTSDDEESVRAGATALGIMVDLAQEMKRVDYFRSEDPVEAARFVVSDVVRAIWLRTRTVYGMEVFAEQGSAQLLRWESRYGWTRRGEGWVAERETSLAQVLAELLVTPDMWDQFAQAYVEALSKGASGGASRRIPKDLGGWHALLAERLAGSDHEGLLAQLPSGSAQ
jgi:hypothetical protein